jgi:hypothetical protein
MRARECDTYTVWSPTHQTVTAHCCCGWTAQPRPQTDVVGATNDEIEHLWEYLTKQNNAAP